MTTTPKSLSLDEMIAEFSAGSSVYVHTPISLLRLTEDLIADRQRLLDEVERLKATYELQIGDLGDESK